MPTFALINVFKLYCILFVTNENSDHWSSELRIHCGSWDERWSSIHTRTHAMWVVQYANSYGIVKSNVQHPSFSAKVSVF